MENWGFKISFRGKNFILILCLKLNLYYNGHHKSGLMTPQKKKTNKQTYVCPVVILIHVLTTKAATHDHHPNAVIFLNLQHGQCDE